MVEWKENPVNDSYETSINGLKIYLEMDKCTIMKDLIILKTLTIEEPMPLYDERELIFFDNGKEIINLFLTEDPDLDFSIVTDAIEEYLSKIRPIEVIKSVPVTDLSREELIILLSEVLSDKASLEYENFTLKQELKKNESFLQEIDKKLTDSLQQLDELVNDYKIFVSSLIDNKNMLEDKLNWLQEVDEKRFDIKFN